MFSCEIYMAKHPSERGNHPPRVPATPEPSSTSAPDGMERARALARRYLPARYICMRAWPSRMLCAKEIVEIAGMIPQATPAPPRNEGPGDSSERN
jgi:hypothetical protein